MIAKMRKKVARMSCLGLIAGLSLLCLAAVGDAKEGKSKGKDKSQPAKDTAQEEVVEVKKMKGNVACFSPRKDPKFIAITVKDKDNKNIDYLFCIDKDVKIERTKSLKEINVGDTIEIAYDVIKITEIAQEGEVEEIKTTVKIKRVAKLITLLKIKAPEINGVHRSDN
jgi:hypothetical protein